MEKTQPPIEPSVKNPMQPIHDLLMGTEPEAVCARYGMTRSELDNMLADYQKSRRQMALAEHLTFQAVGRNEPCPCGSGKKYKKCCQPKHEEARRSMPKDKLQEMEEKAKRSEKLEKDIKHGFELLFEHEYGKAQRLVSRLLEPYPEDDRLHDMLLTISLVQGDYEQAFLTSRRRWQVAQEEKEFYQENGHHKREGSEKKELVHFYSPSTWLEKFWIAQRAKAYQTMFPAGGDAELRNLAEGLKAANDTKRFPGRQEEGLEMRRKALEPVLKALEEKGPAAIPYLLPQTYTFSWASLFIPDLLYGYGTDESVRLLAELSMFRFPFFAQQCLVLLERTGDRAVPVIDAILSENPAFDELKVGLISVLGNIHTPESFKILARLTEHENRYVVNWTAQALGNHQNPEALPYLERAKERLGALSKIAGAIQELAGMNGMAG